MKVLIAHNRYQFFGGEDAVVRSEFKLLRDNGVDAYCYERSNDELTRLTPFAKVRSLLTLGWSKGSYLKLRTELQRIKPDVVHFHNIFHVLSPSVYDACRDEGVPVVQSEHNYRPFCPNGLFLRNGLVCEDCLNGNLWPGVVHACYRRSRLLTAAAAWALYQNRRRKTWTQKVDRYITATEFTRGKYIEAGVPAEKITVKPHSCEAPPAVQGLRQGHAVYIGRLSQEKGPDLLLQAWKAIPDIPLMIIGDGPMRDSLKRFAQENKMIQVTFLGHLDCGRDKERQDFEEAFQGARCVVIPSRCYENFPRLIVEAYARGVPIVASRLGSLAELVVDNKTGLTFEPGDVTALTQRIRWLFADEARRGILRMNCQRVYQEKYLPEQNARALKKIYQQVIEGMS